jgi:hypothetical protein
MPAETHKAARSIALDRQIQPLHTIATEKPRGMGNRDHGIATQIVGVNVGRQAARFAAGHCGSLPRPHATRQKIAAS